MGDVEELAEFIKTGQALLFVGSGATRDTGGATWQDLAAYVCKQLRAQPSATPQETFDELCDYQHKRDAVYEAVRTRLANVKAGEALSSLLKLPWITVYTTNYDTAIEDFYRSVGDVRPNVKTDAGRGVEFGIKGEIIVFKLMGCRTVDAGKTGAMVLSGVDRKRHQREQAWMYEHLDSLASARAVLTVGYGFADQLLLESVQEIRSLRTQSDLEVYSVFRPETANPMVEKLTKLGVYVISAELPDFSKQLLTAVGAVTAEPRLIARLQGKGVALKPRLIRDALPLFDIATEEDCRKPPPYEAFLRGATSRTGAYEAKLQWVREAIRKSRDIADLWFKSEESAVLVVNFVGRPGSGRSVAANDLLHHAITSHRAIGIKVPQRSPRLDETAASRIIAHATEAAGKGDPPALVVLCDEHASMSDVLNFALQVEPNEGGVLVVRSAETATQNALKGITNVEVHDIELGDTISPEEVDSLSGYISRLPADLRSAGWTEAEIRQLGSIEPSFIELMYHLVSPTRQSIHDIVLEGFAELDDDARRLVHCLMVPSTYGVRMPIPLLAKMLDLHVFDVYPLLDKCAKLATLDEDGTSMPLASLFHRRVGEILLGVPANEAKARSFFHDVVGVANLHIGSEHQVVADMLVGIPGIVPPVDKFLTDNEALELFASARERGASRLLLHHYALRLRTAKDFNRAEKMLREALEVPEDELRPTERKEIVLTSLAHVSWIKLKESGRAYDSDSPQVVQVREELRAARTKTRWNPHAYRIEANILVDLARSATGDEKMQLLSDAIGILREGLAASGGTQAPLVEGIQQVLEASSGFTEAHATELSETFGSGHGFFLLYERALNAGKTEDAQRYLRKALDSRVPCVPALRAGIESELTRQRPDYTAARQMSDRLVDYQATKPKEVALTWNDHLERVACLVATGDGDKALPSIVEVKQNSPKGIPRPFPYFFMKGGSRAEFHGVVADLSSARFGSIAPHDVQGLSGSLTFNPSRGKPPAILHVRDRVKFNLAFGVYGITAWDVSPD